MAIADAVRRLIQENNSYQEAAQRLGIPAGKAYLLATGVPADSSDGLSAEEYERPGMMTSAQHLACPRTEQPDRSRHVREFLAARAAADPQMQAAGSQS